MNTHLARSRRAAAIRAAALALTALAGLSPSADAGEQTDTKPAAYWPSTVHARYRLSYNGISVGRFDIHTQIAANTYMVSGSGKVSFLLGLYTWKAGSNVSGALQDGDPAPANYAFEWHQSKKKKDVAIRVGYKDRTAVDVSVTPAPRAHADAVPLQPSHKAGTLDPLSSILILTKANGKPPCERRAGVFDGTQRYDIVFTPKKQIRLPSPIRAGSSDAAHVCRITYEPVAGHRANADTKAYAAIRDVEIVLRRIPNTEMFIPYSVVIPTPWGNGDMVAERMEIETPAGKVAFTN